MPLMQETEIPISNNLLKNMFTAPDHPDMWAPPLNFVTILLARLKDRFQKQIALISVWKVKRYLCSRRSFSQIWNCYKTRYNHYTLYIPLLINIPYILSPLISAFNFPLNWQAKLYTTTLLWQHSTGSSSAHAETGRERQWSIKLSPWKAGRARCRRQCRRTERLCQPWIWGSLSGNLRHSSRAVGACQPP